MMDRALALIVLASLAPALLAAPTADPKRGEYIARAGGCLGCHTEEKKDAIPFAGGRALQTPFGTFYGPNITPHPQAGIGRWSEADFIRAMREGRRPDGAHYYPAFPYPSFTKIRDADLRDLWAYLRSLKPSSQASREHDLPFYLKWRFLLTFWKWLFFSPGPLAGIPGASEIVNRGAYLVQALGHCGECHTPRNILGGPISGRFLAGGKGHDGKSVPNLTPAGLALWSDAQLREFFMTGITLDDDTVSEAMMEVIHNSTSRLTAADITAMIAYLRSLPEVADRRR